MCAKISGNSRKLKIDVNVGDTVIEHNTSFEGHDAALCLQKYLHNFQLESRAD